MLKCEEHGNPAVGEDVVLAVHAPQQADEQGHGHVERQVAHDGQRGQRPVQPVRHVECWEELCDKCTVFTEIGQSLATWFREACFCLAQCAETNFTEPCKKTRANLRSDITFPPCSVVMSNHNYR